MDNEEENTRFLTFSRLVSGLAIIIMVIMGWLFNLIASSSKDISDRQAIASVRSAVNETKIDDVERRVNYIEQKMHKY